MPRRWRNGGTSEGAPGSATAVQPGFLRGLRARSRRQQARGGLPRLHLRRGTIINPGGLRASRFVGRSTVLASARRASLVVTRARMLAGISIEIEDCHEILASPSFLLAVRRSPHSPPPKPAPLPSVDIPYEKFVLDNGLTLIVHEDHKAPVVAVNIWYHVGSKDERPGRTGFRAPVRTPDVQRLGELQGRLVQGHGGGRRHQAERHHLVDRTNYFQNVPTSALDMTLWMESDRMGHLLGAIDQKVLDEQRGVVQNEKRQRRESAIRQGIRSSSRISTYPDRDIRIPGNPSARWKT